MLRKFKLRTFIFIYLPLILVFSELDVNAQSAEIKTGVNIGDRAPNIIIDNVKGKPIELYSLKGNVILIDFWASWCRPCRMENPNIVEAYNSYHKRKFKDAKGFEIFSVSLDKTKDAWIKAIEADKLDWKHHGSDLNGWKSAVAKTYRVSSIPSNFLINDKGIIIAKNLRGIDLHYQIEKLAE
jgi:thiol-disulfide isomerase/thioredoxin